MAEKNDDTSTRKPAGRPSLGMLNTAMAADRTLMAWIRTSLSMMTFGFTLYKVLQALQESGRALARETTPRNAGLVLVVMATVAVIMGLVEFWQTRRQLRQYEDARLAPSPTWIMALLTAMAGVSLFFVIFERIL